MVVVEIREREERLSAVPLLDYLGPSPIDCHGKGETVFIVTHKTSYCLFMIECTTYVVCTTGNWPF